MSPARRAGALAAAALAWTLATPDASAPGRFGALGPGWVAVDYAEIVDGRELTHSGETVEVVLARLAGRPVPPPGTASADLLDHAVLEPHVERYVFAASDALDAILGVADPPLSETAWRFPEGVAQPAWVELLRARKYVVEADGRGRVRAIVPAVSAEPASAASAERAWTEAWPVVRHALAVERARSGARPLAVEVHPYVHLAARNAVLVGVEPFRTDGAVDPRTDAAPPVDLATWQSFLDSGLRLEGGRLEGGGDVRLFGSPRGARPTLLGRPVTLADLAVLYRAVFHGGLAEPYVSLDRGIAPQNATVNYGGRLSDTLVGEVALRADIRFKTFSLGIDVADRTDVRDAIRAGMPEFRTHLERFASDPEARGVLSQQTRLWFYPDDVDFAMTEDGNVLAMGRVRMSAASQRVEGGVARAEGDDPPWTRATIAAINRDYDALAARFPELADLDEVARWLALFAWLELAREEGRPVPDLDGLLAVELPVHRTPREYPQLLAFNALPASGRSGRVDVFERLRVGEALDRLAPADGRALEPSARLERALDRLDAERPENREVLDAGRAALSSSAPDGVLDREAWRAERLFLHQLVLASLPEPDRAALRARPDAASLRSFSVAIGGVDLGLAKAVRAANRRGSKTGGGKRARADAVERAVAPDTPVPEAAATVPTSLGNDPDIATIRGAGRAIETRVVAERDASDARVRIVNANGAAPASFLRHEGGRSFRYVADRFGSEVRLRTRKVARVEIGGFAPATPADGTVVIRLDASAGTSAAGELLRQSPGAERDTVSVVVDRGDGAARVAELSRRDLQRFLLAAGLENAGRVAIPGLSPLPAALERAEALLIRPRTDQALPPWDAAPGALAPEEDALEMARAVRDWRRAGGLARPAVSVAATADGPARRASAPRIAGRAVLVVPEGAFALDGRRARLLAAWTSAGGAPAAADLPSSELPELVVLLTDEPSATVARRLRAWSRRAGLQGRLLAVAAPTGSLRADLAAGLLAASRLAGLGLAEFGPTSFPLLEQDVRAMAEEIARAPEPRAVEDLPGSWLWHY